MEQDEPVAYHCSWDESRGNCHASDQISGESGQYVQPKGCVYIFCIGIPGAAKEKMEKAASAVLDEAFLPSYSESFRDPYRPAYRVVMNETVHNK